MWKPSINKQTKEVTYYNSLYAVNQQLGINAGIVKMVCEKINNVKSGMSTKDGCYYKFEYVKKDLLDDYKKSANIKPKMSDEERKKRKNELLTKWQQKQYKCPRCE